MKIVIDGRWIFPRLSGIGAHTRNLLHALAAEDRVNDYTVLFADPECRRATWTGTLAGAPNFRAEQVPWNVFSPAGQLFLPGLLRRLGADLFHSTNYMIPLPAFPRSHRGRPCAVVTIHDLIPLVLPGHAPRSRKSRLFPLYRRLMREIAARVHGIITVSEWSRGDVERCLFDDHPPSIPIRTVYNGVEDRFSLHAPPPRDAHRDPAAERTILCVGRSDPYKNLTGLIRAFALLPDRLPFPARLVVAGADDPRYPEAKQLAEQLGLGGRVTWTGYLTDDELLAWYTRADLLAHPALYEGFGLPVLEAMATGLPVVCSRAASLPEVAGDAAVLCDATSPESFAAALRDVLTDSERMRGLSERGRRRAAQFTWRRAARETLNVYREVTGRA